MTRAPAEAEKNTRNAAEDNKLLPSGSKSNNTLKGSIIILKTSKVLNLKQ